MKNESNTGVPEYLNVTPPRKDDDVPVAPEAPYEPTEENPHPPSRYPLAPPEFLSADQIADLVEFDLDEFNREMEEELRAEQEERAEHYLVQTGQSYEGIVNKYAQMERTFIGTQIELERALEKIKRLEAHTASGKRKLNTKLESIVEDLSPAEKDILRWVVFKAYEGGGPRAAERLISSTLIKFSYETDDNSAAYFAKKAMVLFTERTLRSPDKAARLRVILDVAAEYCEKRQDVWRKEGRAYAIRDSGNYIRAWLESESSQHLDEVEPHIRDAKLYYHPSIHVEDDYACFSFPVVFPATQGKKTATRLVAIDSDGGLFPIAKHAHQLPVNVSRTELAFSDWDHHRSLDIVKDLHASKSDWESLASNFNEQGHGATQGLLCWCLASFFFPRLSQFPILRVLVPSVGVARRVQHFIERNAHLPLTICREVSKREIERHRTMRQGTTVFSPSVVTNELPKVVSACLEEVPSAFSRTPPVAIIELKYSDSQDDRQDWYFDVALEEAPVLEVPESLGYRLALSNQELRQNDSFQDLMTALSQLLFGCDLPEQQEVECPTRVTLSPTDQDLQVGTPEWIRDTVHGIWKACMNRSSEKGGQTFHFCNSTCLIGKLHETSTWFGEDGWTRNKLFGRLEQAELVESKETNVPGCLDSNDPAGLTKHGGRSGMVVPESFRLKHTRDQR